MFLIFISALFLSFILLVLIDRRTNQLVNNYIATETERLSNNLVTRIIHKELANYDYKLLKIQYNEKTQNKKNISYDVSEINKLTNKINKEVQKAISNLDSGDLNNIFLINDNRTKKFKHIKNGIVCDISLGSIRNSVLFANVGPTIPIKLIFLSQNNIDLDIQAKEYGINNVIVTIYLRITLTEQITMPISSKRKKIIIKEPLIIDIVRGETPYLYDKRIDE